MLPELSHSREEGFKIDGTIIGATVRLWFIGHIPFFYTRADKRKVFDPDKHDVDRHGHCWLVKIQDQEQYANMFLVPVEDMTTTFKSGMLYECSVHVERGRGMLRVEQIHTMPCVTPPSILQEFLLQREL